MRVKGTKSQPFGPVHSCPFVLLCREEPAISAISMLDIPSPVYVDFVLQMRILVASWQDPVDPPPPKTTWVDETKIMAAERTWGQACEALRTSISEVIKDSESALDEFRQLGPETANYTSEMQLLERRLQWLSATVDSEHPERLPEMIAKQKLPLTQETAGETRTTTEDMSAIGRAPPCPSWMSLRTISGLLALGTFRSCQSTAEIKEKNEELKKEKGYILDLVAGTKTALNDMKTAKKRAEAAKKKEKERAAKKEQKQREEDEKAADPQRKRRRTSGRKRQHPVLADEKALSKGYPSLSPTAPLSYDQVLKPWVRRVDTESFLSSLPMQEVTDFSNIFKTSSLRTTEGLATRKMNPEGARIFCQHVGDQVGLPDKNLP